MINLDSLSLIELLEIEKQLPTMIARRQEEIREDVLRKARQLAAKHGLTLEYVMQKGRKHPAKYVNPDNLSEVWSGVGSRPKWVREWLADGKTMDDLKIDKEN